MFPIIIILLPVTGLIVLGFYFYFRRRLSPATFIRECMARILTIFAVVFVLIGIRAPFYAGSIKKVDWAYVIATIGLGFILGYCAARVNPKK
jgi:hypothetical protein